MEQKMSFEKYKHILVKTILIATFLVFPNYLFTQDGSNSDKKYWATGYLPCWQYNEKSIPFMKEDDLKFLTHIINFGGNPKPDGSIDLSNLKADSLHRKLAVDLAHSHNKPILFSVVEQYNVFNQAIEDSIKRRKFINELISIMDSNGYDGIDLDMEPVTAPFSAFEYRGINLVKYPEFKVKYPINENYTALITELRYELDKRKTPLLMRPLLTAAITWRDCHYFGREEVHSKFDQINLMTYDMSNPESGDISWYDSPIYSGNVIFPKYNKPAYSIEMFVNDCIDSGIPAQKLGIGICFDALNWEGGEGVNQTEGVTGPGQTWSKAPSHPHLGSHRYSYTELIEKIYNPSNYHWDDIAKVPYLSFDLPGANEDKFISFNDERAIYAKINFMKEKGLGGFIIWELSADYLPNNSEGKQRPLMKAIHESLIKEYKGEQ
jgi:chitinase